MLFIKKINSMLLALLACLILLVCALSAREQQVEKAGRDKRASLGVTVITPDGEDPDKRGALIESVLSGQAAEKAGLLKGDLIIRVDDREVADPAGLVALIRQKKPGDPVEITVLREGRETSLTAVLDAGKTEGLMLFGPGEFVWNGFTRGAYLGVTLNRLDENLASYFGTVSGGGALVLEVGAETPAARAGLLPGDVIFAADETVVKEPDDLVRFLAGKGQGDQVRLQVLRKKKKRELQVELASNHHFLPGRRFELGFPGSDSEREMILGKIREIPKDELIRLKEKLEEIGREMQAAGRELRLKFGPEREAILRRVEKIKSRVGTRVFRVVSV